MDLTIWDKIPEEQQLYYSRNGRHFNKRLCEYAVSQMRDSKGGRVTAYTKDEISTILATINKTLNDYDAPYDALYVANMAKSDFVGSSLEDNIHIARYINDVMNDADGYDGMILNRWLADMASKGKWIDWERMV